MSKPNLLCFSSSLGIYRNKRIRDLEAILAKELPGKVPFSHMAPMLFQIVMAYAGENQINGDFNGYTAKDFVGIWATNYVTVSVSDAKLIVEGFESVGLFQEGKIRSWLKFNRHLADYDSIVRAKRLAGKLSAKRRQIEARNALKKDSETAQNGEKTAQNGEKNSEKTVQKAAQKDSPSKELWMVNEGLKTASGKRRRELAERREQLISEVTGVSPTPPPSPAPSPDKPPRKRTAAETEREILTMAQTTLADFPEGLSESMVTALVKAGHKLPVAVKARFRDLVAKLNADNPVPE
jgi:hypothetical protein